MWLIWRRRSFSERHVICKNAPYLLLPPPLAPSMLRIMPFCCTFVTLRARDRVASWGTTHPTDPFLILLSEEIMHYKAFNAKTLYIFYLEGEAFSRIANCIALAHLLLMILSSYFPFSCHFSWNVISPLISSPTLSLNWHDEMTKRLLKIWDRDNAWPWQNEGSKLGFWRCIFIVSSAAKAAKAFFRPFPPLARTPELKLAEEAFRICLLHAQIASPRKKARGAERRLLPMHTSVILSFSRWLKNTLFCSLRCGLVDFSTKYSSSVHFY